MAGPLNVSAQQAAEHAGNFIRNMNNPHREVPQLPAMFEEVSRKNSLFIFNVGPWQHKRELGTLGQRLIRPCRDDRPYSDPILVEGVVSELYPMGDKFERFMDDGRFVADSIIGVGPGLDPRQSLLKYGVFVSTTNPPSKELLERAKGELFAFYKLLVNEANLAYSKGPSEANDVITADRHFVAARALKMSDAECPWLKQSQTVASRASCEGCGSVYPVGVIKCSQCGYIVDKQKFEQAVQQGRMAPLK